MKIVVSDIPEEGLGLALEETLDLEHPLLLSPVNATLRVEKTGPEVLVRGDLKADVELQCSRCLKLFSKAIETEVHTVYHPVEELIGEDKHEVKEEELETGFYRGDELDLQELFVEQVLLGIPMKPLCSDSCQGICPRCGADLNTDACRCEERPVDPRFAVLKKLVDKGKE